MIDSSVLYKPMILLSIYMGFINFIAIPQFPPIMVMMVLWYLMIRNYNDDGRYVKFSILMIVTEFAIFTFIIGFSSFPLPAMISLIYIPLGILSVTMLAATLAIRNERFYFNRTIQSMRDKDRKLAKKALKTKDPQDLAIVADYTDWSHVS